MKRWDDETEPRAAERAAWSGLDARQMRILRILDASGAEVLGTGDVIRALGLDPTLSANASVSRSLARLEARGLVGAAQVQGTDGRRKRWSLSPAGRSLLARMGSG